MKKHANKIVIAMCSLALSFFVGCAPDSDNRRVSEIMGEGIDTSKRVGVNHRHRGRGTRRLIEDFDRMGKEAARDTARINAASRRMLYEMELQRKLKELERQREMQRRR